MPIAEMRIVVDFPEEAETSSSDLKLNPDIRAVNYPAFEQKLLEIIEKFEVEENGTEEE